MPKRALLFVAALLVVALMANPIQPLRFAQAAIGPDQAKFIASDGASSDSFGWAVAVSGNTALVSATQADIGGKINQGAVYVFVRVGQSWVQQAKLAASDGAAGDLFGFSVAVSGDTALIGANGADIAGKNNQGAAYIFARSGGVWNEQAKLTASDGAADDEFGVGVALDVTPGGAGLTALVGAYRADVGSNIDAGAAYVFTGSGAVWSQQAKVADPDGVTNDYFGTSVALQGDEAVIGARGVDGRSVANQGVAFVYTRSGQTWAEQAKLEPFDGGINDYFGWSVTISGDAILVGAPFANVVSKIDQGAVYEFTRSGTTWVVQTRITADDGVAEDYFGTSVSLLGTAALIGAYGADIDGKFDQGAAYAYDRVGALWVLAQKATAADGVGFDNFGWSVAQTNVSGITVALVGSLRSDISGKIDQGAAYLYDSPYPPDAPVGIAPVGFVPGALTPTYVWSESPDADLYAVALYDLTTGAEVYTPAVAFTPNCTAGECTGTPTQTLKNGGIYGWYVAAFDTEGGWGPWSAGKAFLVSAIPSTPTPLGPTGIIIPNPPTLEPTFTFTPVEGGVQYAIVLYDLDAGQEVYVKVFDITTTPDICTADLCTVTPTGPNTTLVSGKTYGWFVAAVSYAGAGAWSAGTAFILYTTPEVPTLVSPSGDVTELPTFTWNAVTGAVDYYLLALDSTGTQAIGEWVNRSACGESTCQFTPAAPLAAGMYNWFVLAANPAGVSAYSAGLSINVTTPPPAATFVPPASR